MPRLAAQQASPNLHSTLAWPDHIAIIMDGNTRWAEARKLPRKMGHKQGAEALKRLVQDCAEHNIQYLTVYAFSSENWQRPADEVDDLMSLMRFYLKSEVKQLHKAGIRLGFIGDRTRLSEDIQAKLTQAESLTANNSKMTLIVALSYGAREEILRATRQIAAQVESGELAADAVNETHLNNALDTSSWPNPDLIIRTGGDQRLSNFLLWQAAYSELFFCETLWPDFSITHLTQAVEDFSSRERRFGKRTEKAE